MPVIVREMRSIAGSPSKLVKVYKPGDVPLTKFDKEKADRLDEKLDQEMEKIEKEIKKHGYIKLKGRKGAIKLWYEVGKRLAPVVDSFDLQSGEKKCSTIFYFGGYGYYFVFCIGQPPLAGNQGSNPMYRSWYGC